MAVIKYYTENDLLKRRVDIGLWISSQTDKVVSNLKYGQLLDEVEFMKYEYVVACYMALLEYIPITSAEENGVSNGLTEECVDNIIKNIQIITGLHFLNKETSYNTSFWDVPTQPEVGLAGGGTIELNTTPTSKDLINQPNLGTGTLQLFAAKET